MKLALPAIQVDASEKFVTENFSLGDERVIMNILRSKMYSSPIRTICQEVMSNARDAHREMGKSKVPIEVTLPSEVDMMLRIRDFGPGITPDRMSDVFIKYGNSTKRDSNRQTGGFGLGAKSPFSYSDTFTVISITPERGKMIRREYIAYIDESQLGAMSQVKEEETDEQQGTTIIVPCKPGDVPKFTEAVEETGRYWAPHPKVKGGRNFRFDTPHYSYESQESDWAILSDDHEPRAIVDGISYRIQTALILKETEKVEKKLCEAGLRLFFTVSQMKVTANREDLDYQPDVISKLRSAIHKAMAEINKLVTTEMTTATTYVEACSLWNTVSAQFKWLPESCGIWNGLTLLDSIKPERDTYIGYREFTRGSDRPRTIKGYDCRIRFAKDHLVVHNDTDSKSVARTRIDWLFANHPDVKTIQVVQEFERPQRSCYTTQAEVDKKRKDFYKEYQWDKLGLTKLSQVPFLKPTRDGSIDGGNSPYGGPQIKARKLAGGEWVDAEDLDLVEGHGFYVDYFKGHHLLYTRKGVEVKLDDSALERLGKVFNLEEVTIISVMRRFIPKLGKKWTPLHKKLTKVIRGLRSNPDVRELAGESISTPSDATQYYKLCNTDLIVDKTGACGKMVDRYKRVESVHDKASKLEAAAQLLELNYRAKLKDRYYRFKDLVDDFEKAYPLVAGASTYSLPKEDVIIYINAKDAAEAEKRAFEAAKEAAKAAKKEEVI